ncbi:MAG: hypothetical protein NTX03_14560 [Bacteroidetes bacterium]|nr:hypothetical protein [Bacteroidota bacterium]
MNHLKISLFLLLLSLKSFAQQTDTRKDSFDVIHYAIHLDVSDFTNKSIAGFTDIKAVSLVNNLDNIRLELFKLKVDSWRHSL